MLNAFIYIIIFPLLLLATGINKTEIYFKFSDEDTGYQVVPDSVFIYNLSSGSRHTVSIKNLDKTGFIRDRLENGNYSIEVYQTGYKKMITDFKVQNEIIKLHFHLAPIIPTEKLSVNYIQSLHRKDAMIITGFVVDDNSGRPLTGVSIRSENGILYGQTDSSGYFLFPIFLTTSEDELIRRSILHFEKSGYISEIRRNFNVSSYNDLSLRIRMNSGEGVNTVDIIQNREAVRELLKN